MQNNKKQKKIIERRKRNMHLYSELQEAASRIGRIMALVKTKKIVSRKDLLAELDDIKFGLEIDSEHIFDFCDEMIGGEVVNG